METAGPRRGIMMAPVSLSLPELKKSTNLKLHLKPSVQDVWQNLDSGRYTVGGTLAGKAVLKLNFGSLGGWLEGGESRRSSLRKFARARHSVRKQVAICSEVSFRFDMHNCFNAVVKQK
jgi:hypothetical protein